MKGVLLTAWGVVRRWAHAIQVETIYMTAEGVAQVRRVPLDQVVINRVVAFTLVLMAIIVALLPFGDPAASADLIAKLTGLAQDVAG